MTAPPRVARGELERVIELDLYNERLWVRVGQAIWSTLRKRFKGPFHTHPRLPKHLIVLALDSAFLHGRELLSFFMADRSARSTAEGKDGITWNDYEPYGAHQGHSAWFRDWEETMNLRLFHVRYNRSQPRHIRNTASKGKGDLIADLGINQEVDEMAREVVRLWDEFRNGIVAKSDRRLVRILDIAQKEADKRASAAAQRIEDVLDFGE